MGVRRSDLGIAKKRIRWLPAREYLMVSGSFPARTLDQEPLKDVRVRRAVAMADNWQEVLDSNPLSQGKGAPDPLIPAALKEWSVPINTLPAEGRKLYEPDPAAARQLLTEAGQSGGIRIPVETTAGDGPDWMAGVQVALKNWKAAGIEGDLKLKDYDALVSSSLSGNFGTMLRTQRT